MSFVSDSDRFIFRHDGAIMAETTTFCVTLFIGFFLS